MPPGSIFHFSQIAIVTQHSEMSLSKFFRNLSFQFCTYVLYYNKNKLISVACFKLPLISRFILYCSHNYLNSHSDTIQILYYSNHSHKKQKDSLETRAVLIEIFMLCWNLPSGPKHRGWLQKKTLLSRRE